MWCYARLFLVGFSPAARREAVRLVLLSLLTWDVPS